MMKNRLLSILLLGLLSISQLNAQTILSQHSTIIGPNCVTNGTNYWFSFILECPNSVPYVDSASITIDFGDGSPLQTTSSIIYPPYPFYSNFPYASTYISHNYPSTTGSYTVTVIAEFPGNIFDTVVYTDAAWLTSNCNTLNGKMYRDNNSNCTYDVGDVAFSNSLVKIWAGSPTGYTTAYTDSNGDYTVSVVSGVSYSIAPVGIYMPFNTTDFPVSCASSDTLTLVASSSNTADFAMANINEFIELAIDDSLDRVCFSSTNGNVLLRGRYTIYAPNTTAPQVNAHIFFGDGQDTSFTVTGWYINNTMTIGSIYMNHQYAAPGLYSVMLITTDMNTGTTDTVYQNNLVDLADSCGSLTGYLYNDIDNNCAYTAGEGVPYQYVMIYQNNAFHSLQFVGFNGYYSVDLPPGVYTADVTTASTTYGYTMACAQSATAAITITTSGSVIQDFGLLCNNSSTDAAAALAGHRFRPAMNSYLYPGIVSYSCGNSGGIATLILDPLVTYINSCDSNFTPTVNGNVLTWSYNGPTNTWQSIPSCINLMTDSSAQIGDSLCFTFYITPTVPDNIPQNDTVFICYPVVNSYDPNIKEVSVPGMWPNGDVLNNRTHDYTVFFQNTGNDVAYNIFILDTLDSDLNPATLQILGSSHAMEVDYLNGNVLKFNFNNINLPDSNSNEPLSHGWVRYTIAQDPNLIVGTVIENTAYIYFDINPAIITNTTVNTVIDPSGLSTQPTINANLYPVPADEFIQLTLNEPASGDLIIYNMLGQPVLTQPVNSQQTSIDVRRLPAGVYQLQVNTVRGRISKTVVVKH